MGYLNIDEIEQLDYSSVLKELEEWKADLDDSFEDNIKYQMIETFEDMLVNA